MAFSKSPSYIQQRSSGLYFRYRIPNRLRRQLGCSELHWPLQIQSGDDAGFIARGMARCIRKLLEPSTMTDLSHDQIKSLALEWRDKHIADLEVEHANSPPSNPYQLQDKRETVELLTSDFREMLACNDSSIARSHVRDLLDDKQLQASPGSNEHKLLCYEIGKRMIEVSEAQESLYRGKPVEVGTPSTPQQQPSIQVPSSLTVSEVFEKFAAEKVNSGLWSKKRSRQAFTNAIHVFTSLMGDQSIGTLTKATGRDYKDLLQRYPNHFSKAKRFKGMSALEAIHSGMDYQPISFKTANDQIGHISSLLNWAAKQGHIDVNPLEGLKAKVKKGSGRDDRKPFSPDDLRLLFATPIHTELEMLHPYHYWLPLMALYTGARLEELCQLYTSNIQRIDGIDCICIDDGKPEQHLKNAESKRLIPIHKQLIDLGLMKFVEARRGVVGDGLLFTGLKPINEKYGHSASKWFGRLKVKLGLESGKVFHSFRHTMTDALRATRSNDYEIKRILGHTTGSETHDRYGSNANVDNLNKVIQSVQQPDLPTVEKW